MTDTFKCAMCGGTFEKEWTDEQAEAEYRTNFTEAERTGPRESVCDDCFRVLQQRHGKVVP